MPGKWSWKEIIQSLQRPQHFSTVFYWWVEFEIETAQWGFSLEIIMMCQYCLTTRVCLLPVDCGNCSTFLGSRLQREPTITFTNVLSLTSLLNSVLRLNFQNRNHYLTRESPGYFNGKREKKEKLLSLSDLFDFSIPTKSLIPVKEKFIWGSFD